MIYLSMASLVGLHISVTDAQCTSSESASLNCSHMVTTDITDDTCLNYTIPCCDIGTYVRKSSFKSNTTFCFMNGTHHVINAGISLLVIENVSSISLIGLGGFVQHTVKDKVNEYNFTSYNDDQNITFSESRAVIECNNTFAFVFKDIQILNVKNIAIKNCGADVTDMISSKQGNDSIPDISSAAVLVFNTTNLVFEYTSIQNSTGYGLVGINILHSQLNGSSFVGNNQYLKSYQLQTFIYLNIGCNDLSCKTTSVIYVTSANDWTLQFPGGNAVFVYNYLLNSLLNPKLEIMSSLFALGIDDSIPLNYYQNKNIFPPFFNNRMGTGLGVLVLLDLPYCVKFNITNTVSYRNQAYYGANFNYQEQYGSSMISFQNVNSTRGISPWDGGGFYYSANFPVLFPDNKGSITVNGCILSTDCASGDTITFLNTYMTIIINNSKLFGTTDIWTNSLEANTGTLLVSNCTVGTVNCYGGINAFYINSSFSNCTFNGAMLESYESSVDIADSTFTNCPYGAITALFSQLSFSGNISFINNTNSSYYGGAVYLLKSNVLFNAPANVTFFNNSVLGRGGAVYIEDDPYNQQCNFKFNDPNGTLDNPGININIDYSYANEAGNVLYGGNIQWCNVDLSLVPHYCPSCLATQAGFLIDILNATTQLGNNNGNFSAMVASDSIGVFACVNNTVVFDTQPPVATYPGKTVNISIITLGQLNGASPDYIAYSTCDTNCAELNSDCISNCTSPSFSNLQPTKQYCTNYTYQVIGRDNQAYSNVLYLFPISAYFGKTGYGLFIMYINTSNCPFGFTSWNSKKLICSANDVLTRYNIGNDINTLTVLRNGTMWVGYNSHMVLAVHLHCPYDYCNTASITFRIEDEQDNQCSNNRTGVLCGGCQPNMSAMFGSTRCMACPGQRHLWLLIAFSIMGVALVTMLLLLNCTVSVGTINGLILYANIIRPGILNYYPIEDVKIFVFISWLNLNLGIETCFYDGMDTYAKTWLQFVFPVYVLLLTGAFIFASRWSSRLAHLCRQNAVAVLATLILLTYTNILQTVITVFSPTKPDIGNSTADNPQVWLADGNIHYAQGKHIYILIAGIIVTVTFLIPYTIILLLAPWIQAGSHWKMFSWINKLKPFLDAYQAPFKDQYRYWPGVLLMVRVALYAVFTSNESNDINANLMAIIIILCFYITVANRLSVYKYWPLGILESFFVMNLVFLSCTMLYLNAGKISNTTPLQLIIASTGISFAAFGGIIICHSYVQVKDKKWFKHVSQMIQIKITTPSVKTDPVDKYDKVKSNYLALECREELLEDSWTQ